MPQSMRDASPQVSVNSRFSQFVGSRNSSEAARIATMPSWSRSVTFSYVLDVSPAMIPTMPGVIHSVTARAKADGVFYSLRLMLAELGAAPRRRTPPSPRAA